MKKLAITAVAVVGLAVGAMAQGLVEIDNSLANGSLTANGAGQANWYSGTLGLEIWALSGTTVPAGVNLAPVAGYAVPAYTALTTAGFTKVGSFANQTVASGLPGTISGISGDILTLPSSIVSPAGSSVVLAVVAWNNSQSTWAGATGAAGALAGVYAFVNPTTVPATPTPPTVGLTGWANDLVMMPVPEPGTFALAGLGAAALLIFRRRK